MKKVIFLTAFLFSWFMMDGISQPRSMQSGSQATSHFVVMHADVLNLTADQKTELAALQVAHQQKMRAERNKMQNQSGRQYNRADRQRVNQAELRRENRIENRAEFHSQILNILTEDQKTQLKEIRKDNVRNRHEYRNLIITEALETLALSSEKHAQVSDIFTKHRTIMLAQRLTEIESNSDMGPNRDRDEQWERRDTMHNELKEILTANEYEALTALISPRANYAMSQSDRRRGMNRNR